MDCSGQDRDTYVHGSHGNNLPPTPPGLKALYTACAEVYPDQLNPLQVTALIKYWLGGPDPLDYISMFSNPGIPDSGIPPHWHYISFGLSDLHGDGRVHQPGEPGPDGDPPLSGYGFELTFRLRREPSDTSPPLWPATLLQALAKYVFHSGNVLAAGDHVSWHKTLDGSDSVVEHILLADDPQLPPTPTPFGTVNFVQVVGIIADELHAAQRWNGLGVLNILKSIPKGRAGGPWLVTDMRRGENMFQLDPNASLLVDNGIEKDGSSLGGVSTAFCCWSETLPECSEESDQDEMKIKSEPLDGHIEEARGSITASQFAHCKKHDQLRGFGLDERETTELVEFKELKSLHLTFNLEAAQLLPLALRGRVKHDRHFTYKSVEGERVVTLVAEGVTGKFVSLEHPYVMRGPWLQVLIPRDFLPDILDRLTVLRKDHQIRLPKVFVWKERKLAITIIPDSMPVDHSQFIVH